MVTRTRRLLVPRRSFVRGGKRIPATTFSIKDIGAPGRGPKTIKVARPGFMTDLARREGFIKEGQGITDLSDRRLRAFALTLAREVGPATALRMFQAQISFRARARGVRLANRRKFEVGKSAIQQRFFPQSQ